MKTRELVTDAIIVILDLEITDTQSSFSGPRKIDNLEDLRFLLSKMDEQRKIESERKKAA